MNSNLKVNRIELNNWITNPFMLVYDANNAPIAESRVSGNSVQPMWSSSLPTPNYRGVNPRHEHGYCPSLAWHCIHQVITIETMSQYLQAGAFNFQIPVRNYTRIYAKTSILKLLSNRLFSCRSDAVCLWGWTNSSKLLSTALKRISFALFLKYSRKS